MTGRKTNRQAHRQAAGRTGGPRRVAAGAGNRARARRTDLHLQAPRHVDVALRLLAQPVGGGRVLLGRGRRRLGLGARGGQLLLELAAAGTGRAQLQAQLLAGFALVRQFAQRGLRRHSTDGHGSGRRNVKP
jgi:hypothetical protein